MNISVKMHLMSCQTPMTTLAHLRARVLSAVDAHADERRGGRGPVLGQQVLPLARLPRLRTACMYVTPSGEV